jgi:hypothetical protein
MYLAISVKTGRTKTYFCDQVFLRHTCSVALIFFTPNSRGKSA